MDRYWLVIDWQKMNIFKHQMSAFKRKKALLSSSDIADLRAQFAWLLLTSLRHNNKHAHRTPKLLLYAQCCSPYVTTPLGLPDSQTENRVLR